MKRYTLKEKLEILKYYRKHGMSETQRHYGTDHHTIMSWNDRFEKHGEKGLETKKHRRFTLDQKLEILKYYKAHGQEHTVRKYEIGHSVLLKWERIYHEYGEMGLANDNRGRKLLQKKDLSEDEDLIAQLQRLRLENAYLKKLDALVQNREEKQSKKK